VGEAGEGLIEDAPHLQPHQHRAGHDCQCARVLHLGKARAHRRDHVLRLHRAARHVDDERVARHPGGGDLRDQVADEPVRLGGGQHPLHVDPDEGMRAIDDDLVHARFSTAAIMPCQWLTIRRPARRGGSSMRGGALVGVRLYRLLRAPSFRARTNRLRARPKSPVRPARAIQET
jgi:hypothetical protein